MAPGGHRHLFIPVMRVSLFRDLFVGNYSRFFAAGSDARPQHSGRVGQARTILQVRSGCMLCWTCVQSGSCEDALSSLHSRYSLSGSWGFPVLGPCLYCGFGRASRLAISLIYIAGSAGFREDHALPSRTLLTLCLTGYF